MLFAVRGDGFGFVSAAFAQGVSPASPIFDSTVIKSTVEDVGDTIHKQYFDADLAAKMDHALREGLADGRYSGTKTPDALASSLTSDLYSMSHDKHLSVIAVEADRPLSNPYGPPISRQESVRVSNGGLQRIEILPGNVGYLNISAFFHPDESGSALADAMHILRNTDALIIDLRENNGGSPDTLTLFVSYFFRSATNAARGHRSANGQCAALRYGN